MRITENITRVERNNEAICLYTSRGEILLFLRHEVDPDFYANFEGGELLAAVVPSGYAYHNKYSYTEIFHEGRRIYPV